MISVLLPAYKSSSLLENVFLPGFSKHSPADCELIIYDNGGNADLKKIVEKVQSHEIRVLGDGKSNLGLNRALNLCAKDAKGSFFYLPHTDMYLMPGWAEGLLSAVKNHVPWTCLLCSRSIEPEKGHTDFHVIKDFGREAGEFREQELLDDFDDYAEKSVISGYRMPFLLHRKLWEKMGGVDENLFSYATDDDLVQEAFDAGVRKFMLAKASLVYHLQGKSNQKQTVDKDAAAPYDYFVFKWRERGYQARHPAEWHPELIPNYVRR